MHAFYLDRTAGTSNFDIILDFALKDRVSLYQHIYDEIHSKYPDYNLNITLDLDTTD